MNDTRPRRGLPMLVGNASTSIDSANLFAMALVVVKSVCAMIVSFGMFPLASALCQASGVRLPKGTSIFMLWRGRGEGGRGEGGGVREGGVRGRE